IVRLVVGREDDPGIRVRLVGGPSSGAPLHLSLLRIDAHPDSLLRPHRATTIPSTPTTRPAPVQGAIVSRNEEVLRPPFVSVPSTRISTSPAPPGRNVTVALYRPALAFFLVATLNGLRPGCVTTSLGFLAN